MKGNKVGTMFFISILVLAGIGISYAGFTDSIAIYGSVNTATVDIELVGWYSGTWVYKIWGFTVTPIPPIFDYDVYDLANEILIIRGYAGHVATIADVSDWAAANGGNAQLVSFSEAKEGTTHDETPYDVDFIYDNLFPCIDFSADFIFHYAGIIPAKIDTAKKKGVISFKSIHRRKDGSAILVYENLQYIRDKNAFKCIVREDYSLKKSK